MKTIANILRNAFTLTAALAALQLCSCVSPQLMQQRAQYQAALESAADRSNPMYSDPLLGYSEFPYTVMEYNQRRAEARLECVNQQIEEQEAPAWEMAGMVLQSPVMQQAIRGTFNKCN